MATVDEILGPEVATVDQILGPPPAAPVQPIRVTNDAEYAKVPKGAKYIAPDGKTKVKQ